jgi:hypothetical protein
MIQFDNAVERFGKIILNEMKTANISCWIAGGAIRDYFMGVSVKTDYDMFFPNEQEYEKARAYLIRLGANIKWESGNGMKVELDKKTIDLVKKFFNTPQATIEAFDFTVSMFAIDSEKVYYGESSFIDLSKRQLMINKITYPASTLSRAFRYYKKGFSMCKGEMKKLIESIQEMPKENEPDIENLIDDRMPSGDSLSKFFIGID